MLTADGFWNMQTLTLEYVLDGSRPGYQFTTPTNGIGEAALKTIWRHAMPRGQGWGQFVGARSLKCFSLDDGRQVAFSEVTVTDQADESGRRGIRRAEIMLLDAEACPAVLTLRLVTLPEAVRDAANSLLTFWRWKRILDRAVPKMRRKHGQIVLAYPYISPEEWRVVEAAVLTIVTSRRLRALGGGPCACSLTTLALDHRDESALVAIPLALARSIKEAHVIDLSG